MGVTRDMGVCRDIAKLHKGSLFSPFHRPTRTLPLLNSHFLTTFRCHGILVPYVTFSEPHLGACLYIYLKIRIFRFSKDGQAPGLCQCGKGDHEAHDIKPMLPSLPLLCFHRHVLSKYLHHFEA